MLKYLLDVETGDWSQWGGSGSLQGTNGSEEAVVTSPLRPGSNHAAHYYTPNQIGNTGDHTSRSQIMLDPHSDYGHEGIEEWYAFSFFVEPGSYFAWSGWNNLISYHHANINNTLAAPAHFAVLNNNANKQPSNNPSELQLYFRAAGGSWNNSGTQQYERVWYILSSLQEGVWYDVVHHVLWSADNAKAFQEIWIDGNLVLPKSFASNLYTLNSDGSGGSDCVYLKQGIDTAGGYAKPTTLDYCCTRIAADQASALAAFGGTVSSPLPATVSNSLKAGATLTGTYPWVVETSGPCTAVEYWATPAGQAPIKLGVVQGGTPYTFSFDTTKLANSSYLFGVVEVDSAGTRYPDSNRVTATINNTVAPPPPPPPSPLELFWVDLASATIYSKWKQQNPGETQRLASYAATKTRPASMTSALGRALIDELDAYFAAGHPTFQIP